MIGLGFAAVAVPLLFVLLHFEATQNRHGLVPAKAAVSALFVLTGLVQTAEFDDYKLWILLGLSFSWLGDVALALPQKRAFLVGLVLFLIGHIWYVVAFAGAGVGSLSLAVVVVVLVGAAVVVFRWLRPHVGKLLVLVIAYMVVISSMLACAAAVFANGSLASAGRWLVLVGALAFYLSDLFVARDRFLGRDIVNRRLGLPLYYAGQFLIAFSIGALATAV